MYQLSTGSPCSCNPSGSDSLFGGREPVPVDQCEVPLLPVVVHEVSKNFILSMYFNLDTQTFHKRIQNHGLDLNQIYLHPGRNEYRLDLRRSFFCGKEVVNGTTLYTTDRQVDVVIPGSINWTTS